MQLLCDLLRHVIILAHIVQQIPRHHLFGKRWHQLQGDEIRCQRPHQLTALRVGIGANRHIVFPVVFIILYAPQEVPGELFLNFLHFRQEYFPQFPHLPLAVHPVLLVHTQRLHIAAAFKKRQLHQTSNNLIVIIHLEIGIPPEGCSAFCQLMQPEVFHANGTTKYRFALWRPQHNIGGLSRILYKISNVHRCRTACAYFFQPFHFCILLLAHLKKRRLLPSAQAAKQLVPSRAYPIIYFLIHKRIEVLPCHAAPSVTIILYFSLYMIFFL